jgi:hypothetical protein
VSHVLTLTATSQAPGGADRSATIKLPVIEFAAGFTRKQFAPRASLAETALIWWEEVREIVGDTTNACAGTAHSRAEARHSEVRANSAHRCRPPGPKFPGSSQAEIAPLRTAQSASVIANQAVSRLRPL